MAYQSLNPYDGRILNTFEELTDQQLETALQAAEQCFVTWRRTVLTDITPGTPAYMEEFFGPVALFFRVPDEDAAVALANDSSFGLGGSVFTKDIARGKRIASRIDTGMVFINHPTWTAADLPFGGIKHSGYGRELSGAGIHEFVNKKLIRVVDIHGPA